MGRIDAGSQRLPLAGVRVCDLTWIVAGPSCTRILADFGAEVIRVEHGQHLDAVRLGNLSDKPGPPTGNNSGFFNYLNRNKRSIQLNVRHPMGMELLKRLIAECDVLVENFSSRVMESWGLDYPQLREIRPDIIYCCASGFGHSGRDRDYSTWGPTAQALSGITLMSGLPDRQPAGWGFSYLDHMAGYFGATAVMMALHHRNRTGEGQQIDISQVECGITLAGTPVLDSSVNGRSWRRPGMPPGNHAWEPPAAPHNTYPCAGPESSVPDSFADPAKRGPGGGAPESVADRGSGQGPERASQTSNDRWIAIAVMNDAEWQALVRAMDEPAWALQQKFATLEGRLANQDELDEQIGCWTADQDAYQLMQLLQAAGVRAGVCQAAGDKVERDPQLASRDWWQTLQHAELGESRFDGVAPRLSQTPGTVRAPSPLLGEDTFAVMREILRMSDEEIAEHEALGVFM